MKKLRRRCLKPWWFLWCVVLVVLVVVVVVSVKCYWEREVSSGRLLVCFVFVFVCRLVAVLPLQFVEVVLDDLVEVVVSRFVEVVYW